MKTGLPHEFRLLEDMTSITNITFNAKRTGEKTWKQVMVKPNVYQAKSKKAEAEIDLLPPLSEIPMHLLKKAPAKLTAGKRYWNIFTKEAVEEAYNNRFTV